MTATPRALRKRKTGEIDSQSMSSPPTRLRNPNNALPEGLNYFGGSQKRSSKRIAEKVSTDAMDNVQRRPPSCPHIAKGSLIKDDTTAGEFVDSAYHSTSTREVSEDGGTREPKRRTSNEEGAPIFGLAESLQTLSKRKRPKYKAWSHSPDELESGPGRDRSSTALATAGVDSTEEIVSKQGSITRNRTRTDKNEAPTLHTGNELLGTENTEDTISTGSHHAANDFNAPTCHKESMPTPTRSCQKTKPTAEVASMPASARKRGRPRKVLEKVKAIENRVDLDLGFKDIPSQRKKSSKPPTDVVPLLSISSQDQTKNNYDNHSTPPKKRGGIPNASPQKFSTIIDTESHISNNGKSLEDLTMQLQHLLRTCSNEVLVNFKAHVMMGLTGKRRLPLIHLKDEYAKVFQLVEQTIVAGEGNSMLVMGARGSGKTNLVETVISELASDHRQDFHVVRLNGFIHTDDKIALREIWRQLGREMDVEDDTKSNYADTLTSLLALLSHPIGESAEEIDYVAKSVIFVLDEFDLFASHPRQTLLYNLFDIAQSRNAPIAVLGLTTKVDVAETLEKRVKSRFSQRYVHVSLPKSFTAFRDICLSALTVDPLDSSTITSIHSSDFFDTLSLTWRSYITALFAHDPNLSSHLHQTYTLTKSIPTFLTSALLPISMLSPSSIPIGLEFITHALSPPDSKLSLLPSLSDLELSLLIAAARLEIILDTDMCSFAMAYDEYQQLASKVKMQSSVAGQSAVGVGAKVWGREVAKGAWERLVDLELVIPAMGAKGSMWRVDVALEEIEGSVEGLAGVMGKWCREI